MADNPLTAERLRELLDYDPVAGLFIRRVLCGGQLAGSLAGSVKKDGYIAIKMDGRRYLAHRLAWLHTYGEWPDGHLDHINGNPRDNRIENLRRATRSQNKANSRLYKNSTSGIKGVRFYQPFGKWLARVSHQGVRYHIGYFDTKEDATTAYNETALKLHGEFARLN